MSGRDSSSLRGTVRILDAFQGKIPRVVDGPIVEAPGTAIPIIIACFLQRAREPVARR